MNIFKIFKRWLEERRQRKQLEKRMAELRKRDPFIY
jgi:uncharacterized protein YjiS (DUF1127 family)